MNHGAAGRAFASRELHRPTRWRGQVQSQCDARQQAALHAATCDRFGSDDRLAQAAKEQHLAAGCGERRQHRLRAQLSGTWAYTTIGREAALPRMLRMHQKLCEPDTKTARPPVA
jgi:hypothetical protein